MKYFVVAVDDDKSDFFVEENGRQEFIHGVKQIVIDAESIEEVEVAY
jgi:hypothetical protein